MACAPYLILPMHHVFGINGPEQLPSKEGELIPEGLLGSDPKMESN
jgi:hypothetical protein